MKQRLAVFVAISAMTFVSCQQESITGPYSDEASVKAEANASSSATEANGGRGRRRGAGGGSATATKIQQVEGLIRTVSATELVVLSSKGEEVTVTINEATIIRKGQTPVAAADLQVDWRVHVKVRTEGDAKVALEVIVQNQNSGDDEGGDDNGGQTLTANGAVKSVSGSTLVVNSQSKGLVTVKTDASTIIRKQGQQITVADIKAGDEANCRGTRTGEREMLAVQIEVRGKSKR